MAFEDQRHFIGVLALKSDGVLDQDCTDDLLDRIVAQRLWIDHAIVRDVKRRLIAAGLISDSWQPLAWDKRQFVSDSSKDRVARFRERKKQCNDDVTLHDRYSNAIDTDTDTDTDTEQIKKNIQKEKSRFAEFWESYPIKTAKPQCAAKWKSKGLDKCADAILADIANKRVRDRRWRDGYIPNPHTYLNQERWKDPVIETPIERHESDNRHTRLSAVDRVTENIRRARSQGDADVIECEFSVSG